MSSTFEVRVVPITLLTHPNADSLSIVKPFGEDGYTVVVRTQDWENVDRGAYIEPDSIVPDTEQYAFLGPRGKDRRIRAKRLRGVVSYGLLVPAPRGSNIGDDVAAELGITHYEPPAQGRGSGERILAGDYAKAPRVAGPKYDVENIRKYVDEFEIGEEVVVTEKIHGTNFRATFQEGDLHIASRSFYRKGLLEATPNSWKQAFEYWIRKQIIRNPVLIPNPSLYWDAVISDPDFLMYLHEHRGVVFYGEIYGNVQSGFTYDTDGTNRFRLFDAYSLFCDPTGFMNWDSFALIPEKWRVPVDYVGPFHPSLVEHYSTIPSNLTNNHVREGCVIKPVKERRGQKVGGRLILKAVNPAYLEKG